MSAFAMSVTPCLLLILFLLVAMSVFLAQRNERTINFPSTAAADSRQTSDKPKRRALSGGQSLVMPSEEEPHEGTWLQWPHNYGWDRRHIERYEPIWVEMTKALHHGERVHIIVYNRRQLRRVKALLRDNGLDMTQIDFWDYPTDDVWIRDNGPIFVYDGKGNLVVENWIFNGWGGKSDWWYDDYIPIDVSRDLNLPRVDVDMVNEGGSVEVDGRGTLMAKKSSILNPNRNPSWTLEDAEYYFSTYLGVTHFIWLEGKVGIDITDDHIDGTARFASPNKIVTMQAQDLLDPSEYDTLVNARNADGEPYEIVHLPITSNKLSGGFHGVYVNYYVGNEVVLVPVYEDENDAEALRILRDVYPNRTITGIPMEELYKDGGAAHCVTQQQPVALGRRRS
jgi:agmatine deiminase